MSFFAGFPGGSSAVAMIALWTFLKVTFVLAASLAVSGLMRRSSAAARHLVWLAALIAALVLPLASAWSPIPVRVLPAAAPAAVRAAEPATAIEPSVAPAPAPARVEPDATASSVVPAATSAWGRAIGIGALVIAIWLLGAWVLLGRLAVGAWVAMRIVHRARPLEQPTWQRTLHEVADRLGLDDVPNLVQSDSVKMPFATGLLRPAIVLPAESDDWTAERRCALLIHELAHIKRQDLLGHVVSRVVCALYWFHPLVWTAAKRLRAESERACDDLALMLGTPASDYAEHLLEVATGARDDRMPAVALAMAKPSELEGRMLAILDSRRPRRGPGRVGSAWLVGSLTTLALVVGVLSPVRRATATSAATVTTSPESTTPASASREEARVQGKVEDKQDDAAQKSSETERAQVLAQALPNEADAEESRSKDTDDKAAQKASEEQRVQVLARSLRTDSDPEVRRVAAWGLANFADADVAAKALAEAVAREQDVDVREMAVWALGESHGSVAVAALESAMRTDKSAKVRLTAAWAAGSIGSPTSVAGLTALLADTDPNMRELAAWSIGNCSPEHAPAALIRALGDSDRDVRLAVAWALHTIGDASAADELEAAFHREKDPDVQRGLIRALGSMGDKAVATLTRLVESPDREVRAVAVTALAGGNAGGPWPWPRPEPRPYP
jgi:beta-lactamase regulating signal transducer with metallopeptidase domain/HEAT repeat protein